MKIRSALEAAETARRHHETTLAASRETISQSIREAGSLDGSEKAKLWALAYWYGEGVVNAKELTAAAGRTLYDLLPLINPHSPALICNRCKEPIGTRAASRSDLKRGHLCESCNTKQQEEIDRLLGMRAVIESRWAEETKAAAIAAAHQEAGGRCAACRNPIEVFLPYYWTENGTLVLDVWEHSCGRAVALCNPCKDHVLAGVASLREQRMALRPEMTWAALAEIGAPTVSPEISEPHPEKRPRRRFRRTAR
jgi:hypothetical protein